MVTAPLASAPAAKPLSRRVAACAFATALLLHPVAAPSAVFTTRLEPAAVAAWEKYVTHAERASAVDRPLMEVADERPSLMDLNPAGANDDVDVPGGYIHHWIGAIRIPNALVSTVQSVLEDYQHYPQVYEPDVRLSSATVVSGSAEGKVYDLRFVTERSENLGLRFAFDVRSHVSFRSVDRDTLIDSRSYSIRESKSAKPPYADLMPEGEDHGVLWRLNSYWRLRQTGSSVYAELRVISLSRKPWLGLHDRIKVKARDSLATTLRQTQIRVVGLGAIVP